MSNKAINRYLPILFYLLGAFALFGFDSLVSKFAIDSNIANWATVKSYMMIIGPLMLLGGNSLIVRNPEKKNEIIKFSFLSIFFVSFSILIISFFKELPKYTIIISVFYALTLILSSLLRANLKFLEAQVIQNLWKCIIFIFVIYWIYSFDNLNVSINLIVLICLLSTVIAYWILLLKRKDLTIYKIISSKFISKEDLFFSLKYMLSIFTGTCSTYLEVLIVSKNSIHQDTAYYFRHFLIFTAVSVFFAGYVGFILTPTVRSNMKKWGKILNNNFLLLFSGCTLLTIISSFCLYYIYSYIYKEEVNLILLILISAISLIRIFYVFPTSYIGAAAKSTDLNGFLYSGLIGIVLLIILFFISKYFISSILIAASFASLSNWIFRTSSAYYFSKKIYRKNV